MGASALYVVNAAELYFGPTERGWWVTALPTGALLTLPLARRRSAPLTVLVLVVSGYAGQAAAVGHHNSVALLAAWILAVYSTAAHGDALRSLVALVVGFIPVWVFLSVAPGVTPADVGPSHVVLVVLPWLSGLAVRRVRTRAREVEERAAEVERTAAAEAEVAAAAERARIAREMHDVVAHAVSLVVVQAEAAEVLIDTDTARARQSVQAIQRAGRQALGELRQMLGVLRAPDGFDEKVSRPSLQRLGDLVTEVRSTGTEVAVDVVGSIDALPADVDACAYRVVQESLTNAVKHGAGRPASIRVAREPTFLEVEVIALGAGPAGPAGFGLSGMRERVLACGGDVRIGRCDRGYEVWARLPLTAAVPAS